MLNPCSEVSQSREAYRVLAILMLFLFTLNSSVTGTQVLAPTIANALQLDLTALQWLMHSYTLAAAITLLPFSYLASRLSTRTAYLLSCGCFTLGALLITHYPSPGSLFLGRVLEGMGFATVPLGITLLHHYFTREKRGIAYSLSVMSIGIGLASGPILADFFATSHHWGRWFLCQSTLGVLTVFALIYWVTPMPQRAHQTFDWRGFLLLTLTLTPLLIVAAHLSHWRFSLPTSLLISLCCFSGYRLYQHCHTHTGAIIQPACLQALETRLCLMIRCLFMACFSLVLFILPLWIESVVGLSRSVSAHFMFILMVHIILASSITGSLINRWGYIRPKLLASLLTLVSFLCLLASAGQLNTHMTAGLCCLGLAAGLTFTAGTYGLTHSLPNHLRNEGTCLFFTVANLGMSFGVALVSGVLLLILSPITDASLTPAHLVGLLQGYGLSDPNYTLLMIKQRVTLGFNSVILCGLGLTVGATGLLSQTDLPRQ